MIQDERKVMDGSNGIIIWVERYAGRLAVNKDS